MANAAVIAHYTFDGNDYTANPANPDNANSNLDLINGASPVFGVTASEIQFSAGLNPNIALGFAADDYDGALGFSTDGNADRNFNTTDQTLYFKVTVRAGLIMNLESLEFESLKTRGDNRDGSRVTHAIFVNPSGDPSADGLASDFDFLLARAHDHKAIGESGAESSDQNFTTGRWQAGPIDLSSHQDLRGENTIAIRLYASEGFDRDFGIDNLRLSGQITTVPEPGVFALLFAGSMLTLVRRPHQR